MTQYAGTTNSPAAGAESIDSRILSPLLSMKPWIRLFSTVCFIFAGLTLLGGLGLMAGGALADVLGGRPWLIGLLYIGLALVYFFSGLYLHRAAKALSELKVTGRTESAGLALVHQFRFWRFTGVVTIVMLLLYVIGIWVFVAHMIATM